MQIEFIPKQSTHQIVLKCSENGYTTEFTINDRIEIRKAIIFAIEDHFTRVAQMKINDLLGGR